MDKVKEKKQKKNSMEENARRMADGEPDRTESDLCKSGIISRKN